MATGVQVWSTTASANSTADTNVNWAEGMAPSQVNDSARAVMASVAKWRDDNSGTIVTGGTTAAYTVTSNQVEGALTAGYTIAFQMHATNDTSATLNVDGLGAKPLQVTAGTNLQGGELLVANIYRATYSTSGSGQWLVQGADALGSQANIVTTTNISTGAVTFAKLQQVAASSVVGNLSTTSSTAASITIGAGNLFQLPVISVFTTTAAATWNTTTSNGLFPAYLLVRMVGAGGGGSGSASNGSSGTDTSFNNWTAIGAHGGSSAIGGAAGSGGTNGTGTLIRRFGGTSGGFGGTSGTANAGPGGGSAIGGATAVTSAGTFAGANATSNSGGGGSGGALASVGGGGGGGGEYVEFIVTSPATSYNYTVGAGGNGGAVGSTGGNGAAGRIEVIAYWQ